MTMTMTGPSAPPLDAELERLLRRMRLPYDLAGPGLPCRIGWLGR
jgi:hypothetical protein